MDILKIKQIKLYFKSCQGLLYAGLKEWMLIKKTFPSKYVLHIK